MTETNYILDTCRESSVGYKNREAIISHMKHVNVVNSNQYAASSRKGNSMGNKGNFALLPFLLKLLN